MKQKLNNGDEQDAIEHRRRYKFLRRAGVASEIKRGLRRRLRRSKGDAIRESEGR